MDGIKLAYYQKQDWERFIKIVDDPEKIHDSWQDWHKDYEKMKQLLISQGAEVIEVVLDLDELIVFCRLKGLENNGSARSRFVQEK